MTTLKHKIALGLSASALIIAGAVASPQTAGAANGTQPNNVRPYGANCSIWGQCATLSNVGARDLWVDGKIDNVFARTRILPAGFIMTWANRFPIEGFWLATGDCAWTAEHDSPTWQSYWGSKTRYTYVHMDDFDNWKVYKKPCGSPE